MEKEWIAILVIALCVLSVGGYWGYSEGYFDELFSAEEELEEEEETGTSIIVIQPPNGEVVEPDKPYTPPPSKSAVPVEDLKAQAKNKFTMAAVTDGDFQFYSPGADVSNPYVLALDNIDLGTGSTTNLVVQTETGYDVYYQSDGSTYYDELLDNWNVNYNPDTGKGYFLVDGKSYHAVSPVGAFVDVDTLPSVQAGVNDTGTDGIAYVEADLGGSMWFRVDIGNTNANSEVRDVVMCFRDADGDMEGNEVTAFTASYVSGSTAISIPGDLQAYWEDAMGGGGAECVLIANQLGSSQKARWEFSATVAEANFDVGEEFEITFDDLGDYLEKQYPSRDAKATAESLEVGNEA